MNIKYWNIILHLIARKWRKTHFIFVLNGLILFFHYFFLSTLNQIIWLSICQSRRGGSRIIQIINYVLWRLLSVFSKQFKIPPSISHRNIRLLSHYFFSTNVDITRDNNPGDVNSSSSSSSFNACFYLVTGVWQSWGAAFQSGDSCSANKGMPILSRPLWSRNQHLNGHSWL